MSTVNINKNSKPLERVDFGYLEDLTDRIYVYLDDHRISAQKMARENDVNSQNENSNNEDWLKEFELQPNKQAFYLDISEPSDIDRWSTTIADKLDAMHENLESIVENNSSMDEAMRQKINRFKIIVTKTKKSLDARKKKLDRSIIECKTVSDMQELVADVFGKLIKEKLMELVLQPLYEGMKSSNNPVYQWVLKEVNGFLSDLGVATWVIKPGEILDYNLPFIPSEESINNITEDYNLKDVVKEVGCYAYVFNDNEKEKRVICEGRVSVWRFTQ